jgi:hypothetical protein
MGGAGSNIPAIRDFSAPRTAPGTAPCERVRSGFAEQAVGPHALSHVFLGRLPDDAANGCPGERAAVNECVGNSRDATPVQVILEELLGHCITVRKVCLRGLWATTESAREASCETSDRLEVAAVA